jgi:CheY-like chemotaxis protein
LIDLRMPQGMDGLETARQIRALDEEIQIIFVTAYSDYSTDEIFQQISGAVLWFRKPFHSEELYQAVRNCCNSWNQAKQLESLRRELADRVALQTERLNARMQTVAILQKNSLKRELRMGAMKRELTSLKAYQDLRLLLSGEPLAQPLPLDPQRQPVSLLLVDDSETVRAIYASKLSSVGFQVAVAAWCATMCRATAPRSPCSSGSIPISRIGGCCWSTMIIATWRRSTPCWLPRPRMRRRGQRLDGRAAPPDRSTLRWRPHCRG